MTTSRPRLTRVTTADQAREARRLQMRSIERDQGYGYRPDWHWDLDRLLEVYVDNPRNVMLLAQVEDTVVGACGVRVGIPTGTPTLARLLPPRDRVAQIVRLVVEPEHRRRGLARRLVAAALDHVAADGGYEVAYLHTNGRTPGAVRFWEACGARRLPVPADEDESTNDLEVVHMLLTASTRRAPDHSSATTEEWRCHATYPAREPLAPRSSLLASAPDDVR